MGDLKVVLKNVHIGIKYVDMVDLKVLKNVHIGIKLDPQACLNVDKNPIPTAKTVKTNISIVQGDYGLVFTARASIEIVFVILLPSLLTGFTISGIMILMIPGKKIVIGPM